MDTKIEIGLRLLRWREALNLTQMQLARRMEWRNGATKISNWENGGRFPNIHDMMALSSQMPITIEWIYEGCADRMPTGLMHKIEGDRNGDLPFSQVQ